MRSLLGLLTTIQCILSSLALMQLCALVFPRTIPNNLSVPMSGNPYEGKQAANLSNLSKAMLRVTWGIEAWTHSCPLWRGCLWPLFFWIPQTLVSPTWSSTILGSNRQLSWVLWLFWWMDHLTACWETAPSGALSAPPSACRGSNLELFYSHKERVFFFSFFLDG